MKTKHWAMIAAGGILLCFAASGTRAQGPDGTAKRDAIEATFQRELVKIEAAKIVSLGELAATQPPAEAAKIYEDLFRFAINANLYETAEPFAAKFLGKADAPVETALLAQLVNVVSKSNRGAFDESVAALGKAMTEGLDQKKGQGLQALPLAARLSLLNTYIQRLIHAGRYDIARRALTLIRDTSKEPQVKDLAASRLVQVDLIGKEAPGIEGTDLDGKAVSLADLKGQVVLVLFWASWYAPNGDETQRFNALLKQYGEKGFRIVGVNVDTKQDGGVPAASVLPAIRRSVVENNFQWPTLINEGGAKDFAAAYGVTQLPADVLIGRDGKILELDVDPAKLEKTLGTTLAR